jgi:hypothetical protein
LTGADPVNTERLIKMTASMVGRRQFPAKTSAIEILEFVMTGELETNRAHGFINRRKRAPIRFDLSIADPSGEIYRADSHRQRAELVVQLAHSDGIIFFFDPMREAVDGDAYENFQAAAARLEHEMGAAGSSRLPHHVAVCIVKFDEPRVFSASLEAGYLVIDSNDSYGFPKVADGRAADFFDELYRKFNPPGAPLLRHTIERYFRKDRIRYFTVSSVGFYLSESMRFNPDDYYNLIAKRSDNFTIPGDATLRGNIYPVNVLEPLLWLAAPACYEAALRRRRHDFMRLDPRPEETRTARQSGPAAAAAAPGMVSITGPDHLICLLEISGTDDAVTKRLGRLWQLVSVIAEVNPELPISLISYGSHSFSASQREESVTVLAWAFESTAVLRLLGDLVHNTPAEPEYRLAAQIECALAEVTRRLSRTQECAALVTVGSLPAFPPCMAPDSRTLPCPSRNDWQAILGKLRNNPGVVLGAIKDRSSEGDEIWAQLGTHAKADIDDVDISRFAARLGLDMITPAPGTPDPPAQSEESRQLRHAYRWWRAGRVAGCYDTTRYRQTCALGGLAIPAQLARQHPSNPDGP